MSLDHDKRKGKDKGGNKKRQINELPQAMFPVPTRKGAVSMATLRQISPSNPESRVNFHLALHLMDARELAQTIHNEGLNILMELMSSTGRLPSTRIDGGEVATGTTATSKEITLSAPRTLVAGTLYFLTFQASASVTVATLASASPTLFMSSSNAFVSGYQLTRAYGTLSTWSGSSAYTANPVAIRVRKA